MRFGAKKPVRGMPRTGGFLSLGNHVGKLRAIVHDLLEDGVATRIPEEA